MMIDESARMIRNVIVYCAHSYFFFFFFFFISCDKCEPPFFVYLSKEKLMMQRPRKLPFISRSFLQASKESGGGGAVEGVAVLLSALSIFHECKRDTNMSYLQRWFVAVLSVLFFFSVQFLLSVTF
jgi:hypothetical protein